MEALMRAEKVIIKMKRVRKTERWAKPWRALRRQVQWKRNETSDNY